MASHQIADESPLELRELEPSPVEETPTDLPSDGYFPSEKPRPKRTTALGLGDHGPAFYLTRLQKYSSYAFSVFASLHITNTSIIPLLTGSVSVADSYLLLTRPYYQSRPFEPLLVAAPLAVHIVSGLALRFYRRRQTVLRYGAESRSERRTLRWPAVSGISALGLALVPLALGHAYINRVIPIWYEGSSANVGLEGVSHGFARHPIISFAGFTVLVTTAVWHFTWGWAKWLGWTPAQVTHGGAEGDLWKKRRWYAINGLSATVSIIWLAGGLGVVGRGGPAEGWIAGVYDELYRKIPLVGRWY